MSNRPTAPKRRLTRRGIVRRRELLEAAIELFSELGFEATTTKAIADRAGVTEGVVFRYFDTKQDLFRAVVAEYGPALHYDMPYEGLRKKAFGPALTQLIRGYLDNSWENRRSMKLFWLATFRDLQVRDELDKLFVHRRQRLQEMISERVASGELRPGSEATAAEVVTLATSGFLIRAMRNEPENWSRARDQFLKQLVETSSRGFLKTPGC